MRFIREEIARQVHILFTGTTQGTATHTEDIGEYLPGADTIPERPIMQPFGLASRAPLKTLSVVARQGNHPANMLTLGHRDKNKPDDLGEGEAALYSVGKYQVRIKKNEVQIGKGGAWETQVMGDTLVTLLKAILDHIIIHPHIGNLGFQTSPPQNAADFTQDKTQVDKILAKDGGKF
jgi:hypothetical protein